MWESSSHWLRYQCSMALSWTGSRFGSCFKPQFLKCHIWEMFRSWRTSGMQSKVDLQWLIHTTKLWRGHQLSDCSLQSPKSYLLLTWTQHPTNSLHQGKQWQRPAQAVLCLQLAHKKNLASWIFWICMLWFIKWQGWTRWRTAITLQHCSHVLSC